MSEDEYDAYNLSLDIEDLPYITSLPPSPPTTGHPSQETQEEEAPQQEDDSQESQASEVSVYYTAPSTQLDAHHSDSYSDYDLSEFTADDFATIDAAVAAVQVAESSKMALKRAGSSVSLVLQETNKSLTVLAAPEGHVAQHNGHAAAGTSWKKGKELSPYDRFRARRGTLSVTDLTSPTWHVLYDLGSMNLY